MGATAATDDRRLTARLLGPFDVLRDEIAAWMSRRRLLGDAAGAAVVVIFLALHVARTALDAGIQKIHPAGVSGVGTNSLHDGAAAIERAFETWAGGSERLASLLAFDAVTLARAQTWLELVLVGFSLTIGYAVVCLLRTRVETPAVRVLLEYAALGILLYAALGLFNQIAELALLYERGNLGALDWLLQRSGIGRRLLLLLFIVPVVVALIDVHRATPRALRFNWWRGTTTTYRVLIVVAVLHAALLLFSIPGAQARDGLRLWTADSGLGFRGLVFTSLLALTLAAVALRLGTEAHAERVVLGRTGTWWVVGVGGAAVAVALIARSGAGDAPGWSAGLLAGGVLVAAAGVLSLPLLPGGSAASADATGSKPVATPVATPTTTSRRLVPGVLAAAPLTALTLCLVQASVPSIMDSKSSGWLILWAVASGLLAVAGFCIARVVARWADGASSLAKRAWFFLVVGIAVAVCVLVYWRVVGDPWLWAPDLGFAAIVATFFTALVLVFGLIDLVTVKRPLPASLDFVGFRRFPIVLTLIAWALVGQQFATAGYHDLTTVDGSRVPSDAQSTVQDEWLRWTEANLPGNTATASAGGPRQAVPMVFVAAAGGGIKAAAFTAATIDCVFVAQEGVASDGVTPGEPVPGPGPDDVAVEDVAPAEVAPAEVVPADVTSDGADTDVEPAEPDEQCTATDAWSTLFAASGASGGSVGIASVMAELAGPTVSDTWVEDRLGRDMLSPELAWQVFVEVPNAILKFNPDLDRAEVLQESWRRAFQDGTSDPGGQPFYTAPAELWSGPIVYLSGTNLNDGCRVNISRARSASPSAGSAPTPPVSSVPDPASEAGSDRGSTVAPGDTRRGSCKDERIPPDPTEEQPDPASWAPDQAGTRDLTDYLCSAANEPGAGENIDLATAAFLSARFPVVSPTGTARCADGDPATTSDALSIGDAGYRDNSGAGSLMEAWAVLEPLVAEYNRRGYERCVVPIFVEINNGYGGYSAPAPSTDVAQLVAPILGAVKVFSDLSYGPIEQAAAEFSRPVAPDVRVTLGGNELASRFFRVSLVDNPGVTAPLGWSLSERAVEDLVGQLDLPENRTALTTLRDLLAPESDLACEPPGT